MAHAGLKGLGFNETIARKVSDPASQLHYLIDMCVGKAHDSIKFCSVIDPPAAALAKALATLANKFGKKYAVVKAHLDSITEGPPVKSEKESLSKLASDMTSYQITLKAWGYDAELNASKTLAYLFKRSPLFLQRKFNDRIDVNSIFYSTTFAEMLEFVEDAANRANSLFGQILSASASPKAKPRNRLRSNAFPVETCEVSFDSKGHSCLQCGEEHPLWRCTQFQSKSVKDRCFFVKRKSL